MDTPEVKAQKELTKAINSLTQTLKATANASGKSGDAISIFNDMGVEPVAEVPYDGIKKMPAYLPTWSMTDVEDRTSNGFAKIHSDHIEVHLPADLYPDLTRNILAHGDVTGVVVTLLHRRKTS